MSIRPSLTRYRCKENSKQRGKRPNSSLDMRQERRLLSLFTHLSRAPVRCLNIVPNGEGVVQTGTPTKGIRRRPIVQPMLLLGSARTASSLVAWFAVSTSIAFRRPQLLGQCGRDRIGAFSQSGHEPNHLSYQNRQCWVRSEKRTLGNASPYWT